MTPLYRALEKKIDAWRKQVATLKKNGGDKIASQVSVAQILGGMRGVQALMCDTSVVDPQQGLLIRGNPIAELGDREPEEVFYLLCTGDLPDPETFAALRLELGQRSSVPDPLWRMLDEAPEGTSLMTILSMGVLGLQADSSFRRQYSAGLKREDMWRPLLDDCLSLIAKLPTLAAGIYRLRVLKQKPIAPSLELGLAANFVHMLGSDFASTELIEVIRTLMLVQSDHEGGNVCNLTCQVVNSVHADPFLAYSAGINGLAGPLHGLASQHAVHFLLQARDALGPAPTDAGVGAWVNEKLDRGEIIPGFGHAVLRETDPRFTILFDLGKQYCGNSELFALAGQIYRVVPDLLKNQGKVAMPYPNVDAISGPLLYHYGLTELPFYTVVFALSMVLGMSAQMVINRALMIPIFRPRSVSSEALLSLVQA